MRSRGEFSPISRTAAAGRQPRRVKVGQRRRRRFPWSWVLVPIVIWFGIRAIHSHYEQPDAIFVLGGSPDRELFTAEFAQEHPKLPIWISSGTPRDYSEWVFSEAGVDLRRLNLDYEAVDTVTNFTSLADRLQQKGIHSVYLVTSDYHMRRARIIGEIVMGSRGIHIKPVSVPSTRAESEPLTKAIRDGGRAILWVMTGHTGSTLAPLKGRSAVSP